MSSLKALYKVMVEIITRNDRHIQLISQRELRDPLYRGEYVRAYCHIHGSDHQRSLSINRRTGWGHCFNATCEATVLVEEWNPQLAHRFLSFQDQEISPVTHPLSQPFQTRSPRLAQPVLLLPSPTPPQWQQEEQRALLSLDTLMRNALVQSDRAQAYLRERGIPLQIARAAGIGYLPPELLRLPELRAKRPLLQRWTDRLLLPLHTPDGQGYIGRSLWRWVPGMDEHLHKSILDRSRTNRRWVKTNPAGWFGYDPENHPGSLVLVEGAFDRLALLAAGMRPADVVALAGTAIRPDWIPAHVTTVILALDADPGGDHAAERLVDQLEQAGIHAEVCPPPRDGWGTDWSERWRKVGRASVRPLFEARALLAYSMSGGKKGA